MNFALANLPMMRKASVSWSHATIADLNMHHVPTGSTGLRRGGWQGSTGRADERISQWLINTFGDKRTELRKRVHTPLIRLQRG